MAKIPSSQIAKVGGIAKYIHRNEEDKFHILGIPGAGRSNFLLNNYVNTEEGSFDYEVEDFDKNFICMPFGDEILIKALEFIIKQIQVTESIPEIQSLLIELEI